MSQVSVSPYNDYFKVSETSAFKPLNKIPHFNYKKNMVSLDQVNLFIKNNKLLIETEQVGEN